MKTLTISPVEHLYLDQIADLIAYAMNPQVDDDPEDVSYQLSLITAKKEVNDAATSGVLKEKVRHPQTHGPFPMELGLKHSVVLVPDVVAFLADYEIAVVMEAPKQTPQPQAAPEQEAATPAPVVVEQKEVTAKAAPTGPRLSTNKAALVAQHKHEWPTIERDIKDASENGLSKVAKAGVRDWNEDAAMQWARSKNKLIQPTSATTLNSVMSTLSSKIHRLEG